MKEKIKRSKKQAPEFAICKCSYTRIREWQQLLTQANEETATETKQTHFSHKSPAISLLFMLFLHNLHYHLPATNYLRALIGKIFIFYNRRNNKNFDNIKKRGGIQND